MAMLEVGMLGEGDHGRQGGSMLAFVGGLALGTVLGAALALMLALHRGVVLTLVAAGAAGTLIALPGGPLPH